MAPNEDINAQDKYGRTKLHHATRYSRSLTSGALKLLVQGASCNIQDRDGKTPLHNAVYGSSLGIRLVRKMLELGADCNIQDRGGETPFYRLLSDQAHRRSNRSHVLQLIPEFLQHGADSNIQANYPRQTPLHVAVKYFSTQKGVEIADEMLKNGDCNIQSINGETVLHRLLAFRDHDSKNDGSFHTVIEKLFKNGADCNIKNNDGHGAFQVAVLQDHDVSTLKLLVKHGANPLAIDNMGKNALHYLKTRNWFDSTHSLPVIEYLLQQGCDLTKKDNCGNTPLNGLFNSIAVNCMIENGALVNTQNNEGKTALHRVARSLWPEKTIKCLLENGAGRDITDTVDGNTPLHEAVTYNGLKSTRLLLEAGCDVDIQNHARETPLHLALRKSYVNDVDRIVHFLDIVSEILKYSPNVDLTNEEGRNALLLMSYIVIQCLDRHDKLSIVRRIFMQILKMTHDVNCSDVQGNSALILLGIHIARVVDGGSASLILELLNRGADIARHNRQGQSFYVLFKEYSKKYLLHSDTLKDIREVVGLPSLECLCVHAVYPLRDRVRLLPNLPILFKCYLNID